MLCARQLVPGQIISGCPVNYIAQIINYIRKAQEITALHGFKNLLQPGLVKELVVADILGHEVHRTKHEPDAYRPGKSKPEVRVSLLFRGRNFPARQDVQVAC